MFEVVDEEATADVSWSCGTCVTGAEELEKKYTWRVRGESSDCDRRAVLHGTAADLGKEQCN